MHGEILMPSQADVSTWAARITERWRTSIESIFESGRLLIEAKRALPHGAFGKMIEGNLPFGPRMAQMLMAIAADERLSNAKRISHLPASSGALYELTKLSDDELDSAFEQQIIRPDMLRADAEQIRPLTRRPAELPGESGSDGRPTNRGLEVPFGGSQPLPSELDANAVSTGVTAGETAQNSTPMPNGARAIAHQRIEPADSLDFFPTPPWATRALVERVLKHLERRGHCKFQIAWEPACGEGHMAEVLREYFRSVHASDIRDYGHGDVCDFLAPYASAVAPADWIITNPPFGDKTEAFVLRALDLAGTGVAMFVRLQWLETIGRYERLFKDNPPTLISFFAERVPLHKDRWEPDGDTLTAYIWLVWLKGAAPQAPFWIPPGCSKELSKPDDAERFTAKPVKRRPASAESDAA